METFIYFIAFVFGVLNLVLFFKIWGMTDNVKEMLEIMKRNNNTPVDVAPPVDNATQSAVVDAVIAQNEPNAQQESHGEKDNMSGIMAGIIATVIVIIFAILIANLDK